MSLTHLTLDQWRSLDLPAARRVVQEAADQAGGHVTLVETVEHLGSPLHRARVERHGQEFALIPGGTVSLGFDLDAWQPTPEQRVDYAESLSQGYGNEPDLKSHLAELLSPRRTVTLATVLMAVEDENLTDLPAETPALLAARGLRMPSADEWEHACGAGASTLFRWGNQCSLDLTPYEDNTGPQHQLNAFGLRIAYDVYRAELSSDVTAIHGGDGGEAVCGGYGSLLAWLPLATANRNPYMAEFVHGPDGEDLYEDFSTRPVLTLA
jgi:formylglycine-generating enzyme required for sulfatase activity